MLERSVVPVAFTKDEFRRRFRAGLIAAWLIPPVTGELGMTFLGFWELKEAGLSLIRFTGLYVVAFTLVAFFLFKRLIIEPALALGDRQQIFEVEAAKTLKAFPWVFWGLLGLYTSCGPATVLLSNAAFQGTQYAWQQYAFSVFGAVPFLLIAAFPLFFHLTDLLGRFLAPRGLIVMVAPLWLKLVVLGLFTPVMIDTILLTYYRNRTGFLEIETIVLWLALILIAGAGTLVAVRSFRQGFGALTQPLGDVRQAATHGYPTPQSLDEFGLLARGWADLLHAKERAEGNLRQSESRLSGIVQVANDAIVMADQSQRIVLFNDSAEQVFGYSRDEILGRSLDMLVPERFRGRHRTNVERFEEEAVSARQMQERSLPLLGRRKNGEEFPLEASIAKLDLGNEKVFTVALRDISERVQTDNIRRRQSEGLSVLDEWVTKLLKQEGSVEEFYELVNQGILTLVNADLAAIPMLDESRETFTYVAAAGAGAKLLDGKTMSLEGGGLCGWLAAHGEPLHVPDLGNDSRVTPELAVALNVNTAVLAPLRQEDRIMGGLSAFRNGEPFDEVDKQSLNLFGQRVSIALINLRLRLSLEQRVAARTRELATANERLTELDRLKSMFIASMSHELRTPLNSIIGFTGIILQGMVGDLNQTQKDQLSRVYRASKHLLELITDVIDISKIEAGKIDAFPTEFVLDELIDEAASGVEPQLAEQGLTLAISVPQGVLLRTDRKRLLQCVLNYVSNAVKFTEAGDISIAVREIGANIEVDVSDTGIGVPDEDASKLFQPFVRLDSPLKSKTHGTGLGLYLTRKLVTEVLGGSVDVKSEPGRGSTFSLVVPKNIGNEHAHDGDSWNGDPQ